VSPRTGLDTEATGKILFAPAEIEPPIALRSTKANTNIRRSRRLSGLYKHGLDRCNTGTLVSYPVQDINVRVSTGLALGRSSSKGTYRTLNKLNQTQTATKLNRNGK
jgi:hypothetical protein